MPRRHRVTWGLVVLAWALHGPVDLVITASAPNLESNPIVLTLGWSYWLVVKAAVLCALPALYWQIDAPDHALRAHRIADRMTYLTVWVMVLLGGGLVLPNALVLLGVL